MLRILLTGAAMIAAAPAIAQQVQPADPAMPAQPAESSALPSTPDSDPAAAAAQANPAATSQIASVIDAEFPVYDADKSGELEEAEFSKWLIALKQLELKSTGKTMAQAELTTWASSAFATADVDQSAAVTKTELTRYLGG